MTDKNQRNSKEENCFKKPISVLTFLRHGTLKFRSQTLFFGSWSLNLHALYSYNSFRKKRKERQLNGILEPRGKLQNYQAYFSWSFLKGKNGVLGSPCVPIFQYSWIWYWCLRKADVTHMHGRGKKRSIIKIKKLTGWFWNSRRGLSCLCWLLTISFSNSRSLFIDGSLFLLRNPLLDILYHLFNIRIWNNTPNSICQNQ